MSAPASYKKEEIPPDHNVAEVRCGQANGVLPVCRCQEPSTGPKPMTAGLDAGKQPHLDVFWELPHESISLTGFESSGQSTCLP